MKKILFTVLTVLIFNLNGWSQCLPDGIIFSSQAEIDNFPLEHPGCTIIGGDVQINDYDGNGITNLDSLRGITAIGGSLTILYSPLLTNLKGLGNLTTIGGALELGNLSALSSLNDLVSLTSVGNLSISNLPLLMNLNGLEHITSVGESVELSYDSALVDLNGLGNLTTVGKSFDFLVLPKVTSLSAFTNLTSVGAELYISNMAQLSNLNGLEHVSTIGGLHIQFNPVLASLSALQNVTKVGTLEIVHNDVLPDLSGLEHITTVGNLYIQNNLQMTDLSALGSLTSVEGDFDIQSMPQLAALNGFENLSIVTGSFEIYDLPLLTNLNTLAAINSVGGEFLLYNLPKLQSLNGLGSLTSVGDLSIVNVDALTDLSGLDNLTSAGWLHLYDNDGLINLNGLHLNTLGTIMIIHNASLASLQGLETVTTVKNSGVYLQSLPQLADLSALENIISIDGDFSLDSLPQITSLEFGNLNSIGGVLYIYNMAQLTNITGFNNLNHAGYISVFNNPMLTTISALGNITNAGSLNIINNDALTDLSGLSKLNKIEQQINISDNDALASLNGLENIDSVGFLQISNNAVLTSLSPLGNITSVAAVQIIDNPSLSSCAVLPLCNALFNDPDIVSITNNAPGCNDPSEVEAQCNSIPVVVDVRMDNNNNCLPDASDAPVANVQVRLEGTNQMLLKATGPNGHLQLGYLETGPFSLQLPQFPAGLWNVCQDPIALNPNGSTDTIRAAFLLSPMVQCPELTVKLGLPSFFRGCLTYSFMEVSVQNTGTIPAQGVKTAVIMPAEIELLGSTPPVAVQSGDTLYFELGDLPALASTKVQMTVKTKCDTFLIGQALCFETVATLENPCPNTLPAFSEIKLSAQCIGDTMVRFTIKNIGDAPTQTTHSYRIIRNDVAGNVVDFSLNAQQSIAVDVPADGATYRMEATKFDDGTLTATALEHCGGFTPGWITAFWLDKGPLQYDFDCRDVIGSYDPNLKTAVPTGAGPYQVISANQPLHYTIDFQNTGTDTAFRVLLRDVLSADLDVSTFRPGFASHPYTWEIRGNTLNVLFAPIALPDSNVNEPASHGFFSFEINQQSNLPDGTNLSNTASIIFDFNPPIVTNTVWRQIGQLTVEVEEQQDHAALWRVLGNPTRETATFEATVYIPGEKRFELYDVSGRCARTAQFSGQTFDFHRDKLPAGLYFFRINDAQGRVFSGKIVVAD